MDAISTEFSPAGSDTPPMSPFGWVHRHHSQPLPPLRSLPTWSRTKIGANKKILTVQPNHKVKLELLESVSHVDSHTQTSPPLSRGSSSVSSVTSSPLKNLKNARCHSSDKNLLFLQTSHKFVLSNLHQEVEKLKAENKALQFQLIMANDSSQFPNVCHHSRSGIDDENNQAVLKLLEEIKTLENSLKVEQSKNSQLIQQISDIKERSTSAHRLSAISKKKGLREDSIDQPCFEPSSSRTVYESKLNELKQLTKEQKTELLLLRDKLQDPSNREKSGTVLPRLKQRNRSGRANETPNYAVNLISQKPKVPLCLPTLQPLQKDLTSRQKRAQAMHVQRQRSSKDIRLMCDQ